MWKMGLSQKSFQILLKSIELEDTFKGEENFVNEDPSVEQLDPETEMSLERQRRRYRVIQVFSMIILSIK